MECTVTSPNEITDRAKRYRAQNCIEQPDKICVFCGSHRNVMVGHVNGDESDGTPENLVYTCRPCNASVAVFMARNGFGRRTIQYNPKRVTQREVDSAAATLQNMQAAYGERNLATERAWMRWFELNEALKTQKSKRSNPQGGARSLGQWIVAVTSMKGSGPMKLADAVEMVRETSPSRRSEFAREIWRLRRSHGTDKTGVPF